jgi:hypothetical protein
VHRLFCISAALIVLTACAQHLVSPPLTSTSSQSHTICGPLTPCGDSLPKCNKRLIFVQKKTLREGTYTITEARKNYAFAHMTVRNHLRAATVTVTAGKVMLVVDPAHVRSAKITGKTIEVSQRKPGKGPGVEVNAITCKQ